VRRVAVALVTLAARSASADHAAAEKALAEAEALATKGDFAGAAAKYRAAYAAEPSPDLICNLGIAYQQAQDLPRAHLYLNECLLHGTSLDAQFANDVRANVAAIEASLHAGSYTPFEITVEPGGATIAVSDYPPEEAFVGARLIWLPYGAHTINVRAEGYVDQTIAAPAKEHTPVTLHVRLERPGTPPPPPPPPEGPPPSKVPLYVSGGVTVGAIALGTTAFLLGHRDAEDARIALTQKAFDNDKHGVDAWNSTLAASGLIAIAGAAATTFFYLKYHRDARVGFVLAPSGGELWFSRAF